MKNRLQREIDGIVLANLQRFMREYYDKGKTRTDLADAYNKITGKTVDPAYFSQLSGGHSSLGKEVIETLSAIFRKDVYLFYVPEEVQIKNIAMRGRYISVWNVKHCKPASYTQEGLPMGVSMIQELSDSTDPYVFGWEITEDQEQDYDGNNVRVGDRLVIEPGAELENGSLAWCRSSQDCHVFFYFAHNERIQMRPVNPKFPSQIIDKDAAGYQIYPVVKIIRNTT